MSNRNFNKQTTNARQGFGRWIFKKKFKKNKKKDRRI